MSSVHRGQAGEAPWARRREEPDAAATVRRVCMLADLLDSRFEIPGLGVRLGLDAIVGLIPVVGDVATTVAGAYIVSEAARLGVRRRILARMAANLAIDFAVGSIPGLDIIFDVAFKANNRNVRLLIREYEAGRLKKA